MRAFLLVAFILLLGGVAYWFWPKKTWRAGEELPSEALTLDAEVIVGLKPDGLTRLNASSWNDLLFAQGMQHGKVGGEKLLALRTLFQGFPGSKLPREWAELASLFYWIDLQDTAAKSKRLYPPYVLALLENYVAGLNETNKAEPAWKVEDVLLLQRGYAFFLDQAWRKEWAASQLRLRLDPILCEQALGRPVIDPSPLGLDANLHPDLSSLMGPPFFRLTRIRESGGKLVLRVEAQPFWCFLFQPTRLELEGVGQFEGLALVGQPFLQSAATPHLRFLFTPILDRNDGFAVIPHGVLSDSDGFRNEEAPARSHYGAAPFHLQAARLVSDLASGAAKSDFYYRWEGLKPSADLLTAFLLLQAVDIDQAMSAISHSQVPAAELNLSHVETGIRTLELRGKGFSSETLLSADLKPFTAPVLSFGYNGRSIRSMDFDAKAAIQWEQLDHFQNFSSELDEELARIVGGLLETRLQGLLPQELRNDLRGQLRAVPTPARAYLIHLLWGELNQAFGKAVLEQQAVELANALEFPLKRLTLMALRASQDDGSAINRYIKDPRRILAKSIESANSLFLAAASQQPPYPMRFRDTDRAFSAEFLSPGADAPLPIFSADETLEVDCATLYLLSWGEETEIWSYPYATDRTLGHPKITNFNAKTMVQTSIKPKL